MLNQLLNLIRKVKGRGIIDYITFSTGKLMTLEDREVGNVSSAIWKDYITAAGG